MNNFLGPAAFVVCGWAASNVVLLERSRPVCLTIDDNRRAGIYLRSHSRSDESGRQRLRPGPPPVCAAHEPREMLPFAARSA